MYLLANQLKRLIFITWIYESFGWVHGTVNFHNFLREDIKHRK